MINFVQRNARSPIWIVFYRVCLLCTSFHKTTLQTTASNFWCFILITILFYYTTVNFNLKLHDFFLTVDWFRHILNYIYVLILTTLKMTTWAAETYWWPLFNKITSIKPKFICWSTNKFYASDLCTEYGTYQKYISYFFNHFRSFPKKSAMSNLCLPLP